MFCFVCFFIDQITNKVPSKKDFQNSRTFCSIKLNRVKEKQFLIQFYPVITVKYVKNSKQSIM